MKKSRSYFESGVCGRCCGSGRYGPLCVYGGICFKCNGRGWVLSKRGSAANNFYNEMRECKASEFKVGDLILAEGFSAGSMHVPSCFLRVEKIEYDGSEYEVVENGVSRKEKRLVIHAKPGANYVGSYYKDGMNFGGSESSKYYKGYNADEKGEMVNAALVYEAMLGKNGKIMKKFEGAASCRAKEAA